MKRLNRLQDDSKTRDELLDNVEIQKTTYADAKEVVRILKDAFGIRSFEEAVMQLLNTRCNLNQSVKIVDKRDNKIYGILLFSLCNIENGSPMLHNYNTRIMGEYLQNFTQINGFAFVLDERIRGSRLDKEMLLFNKEYLDNFDFIWCAVDNELESHHYWERLGFVNVCEIAEATFYIRNFGKKTMNDIFIIKALLDLDKDENDYN